MREAGDDRKRDKDPREAVERGGESGGLEEEAERLEWADSWCSGHVGRETERGVIRKGLGVTGV